MLYISAWNDTLTNTSSTSLNNFFAASFAFLHLLFHVYIFEYYNVEWTVIYMEICCLCKTMYSHI